MAKQVILAVAGAGKTYYICHAINPNKRNLILAYTRENIHNIQRELFDAYECIPESTTILTFDSFVYHNLILPYEPSIAEHFGEPAFVSRGICTIDPPPMRIQGKTGEMVPNPYYSKKDVLSHYITENRQYYCATLSELALQVKRDRESLVKRAVVRLNLFYDAIWIDEFQDFREYDYDLIMALTKQLNNVMLVGDYYQHSVSATNNSGKPFKKKSKDVGYDEFVAELRKAKFDVDMETLKKSRRCSIEICNYVSSKLGIDIKSNGNHDGSIIWVDETNAKDVLDDDQILKLVIKEAALYSFRAMNWSYSKGDTVDSACVILTEKFETLDKDSFSVKNIPISTLNRLYVAMTRSCGNLYLMKYSTYVIFKELYYKK